MYDAIASESVKISAQLSWKITNERPWLIVFLLLIAYFLCSVFISINFGYIKALFDTRPQLTFTAQKIIIFRQPEIEWERVQSATVRSHKGRKWIMLCLLPNISSQMRPNNFVQPSLLERFKYRLRLYLSPTVDIFTDELNLRSGNETQLADFINQMAKETHIATREKLLHDFSGSLQPKTLNKESFTE